MKNYVIKGTFQGSFEASVDANTQEEAIAMVQQGFEIHEESLHNLRPSCSNACVYPIAKQEDVCIVFPESEITNGIEVSDVMETNE